MADPLVLPSGPALPGKEESTILTMRKLGDADIEKYHKALAADIKMMEKQKTDIEADIVTAETRKKQVFGELKDTIAELKVKKEENDAAIKKERDAVQAEHDAVKKAKLSLEKERGEVDVLIAEREKLGKDQDAKEENLAQREAKMKERLLESDALSLKAQAVYDEAKRLKESALKTLAEAEGKKNTADAKDADAEKKLAEAQKLGKQAGEDRRDSEQLLLSVERKNQVNLDREKKLGIFNDLAGELKKFIIQNADDEVAINKAITEKFGV